MLQDATVIPRETLVKCVLNLWMFIAVILEKEKRLSHERQSESEAERRSRVEVGLHPMNRDNLSLRQRRCIHGSMLELNLPSLSSPLPSITDC